MADFSTNDLRRESVPANATPTAPVTEGPNPFMGLISTVAKEGLDFLKASDTSSALSDYNKRIDSINQKLEQGVYSQSKATAEIRSTTSRALAANPQLTKEISQAHNAFTGATAVGEALDAEEQKKEIQQARAKEATLAGWVVEGANAEETRKATNAYFADKRVDEQIAEMRETAEFELSQARGKSSLAKSKMEAAQLQRTEQANQLLRSKVQNNFVRFNTSVGSVIKNINRSDPQQVRAAAQLIDQEMANIRSEANNFVGFTSNDIINQQLKPFEDLAASYKTALTDEDALTTLENQIGLIEKSAAFGMYTRNPDLAKLNATSDIMKNMPVEVTQLLLDSPSVGQFYKDVMTEALGSSPDPLSGGDQERQEKMKVLTETLTVANEEDRELAVTGINKMLTKLDAFALAQDNPVQFRELSKFLASPEFAKMVNKGELEEAAGLNALQVMNVNWENSSTDAARKSIESVFNQVSGRQMNMSDIFDLNFAGTQLTVTQKKRLSNPLDRGAIDSLARGVRPALQVITQNIKMTAHLRGTTDYKQVWEDQKHNYFPDTYAAPEGVTAEESAEIDAAIESGDAVEVTPEQLENMEEEQLLELFRKLPGSQRSAILKDAGFEG